MKKFGTVLDVILSLPFGAAGFMVGFFVTSFMWGFRGYERFLLWLATE